MRFVADGEAEQVHEGTNSCRGVWEDDIVFDISCNVGLEGFDSTAEHW